MALRSWAGPMAAEQVEALLHEAGELGVGGQLAEAVGAQRDDEPPAGGEVDQSGEERLPLGGRLGQGEGLLALVDDEHRPVPRRRLGEDVLGVGTGRDDLHRCPSRTRAAATPARISEDLPQPDGPTTARTPVASSRPRHAVTSASRPK